jgi:hypothetical protein
VKHFNTHIFEANEENFVEQHPHFTNELEYLPEPPAMEMDRHLHSHHSSLYKLLTTHNSARGLEKARTSCNVNNRVLPSFNYLNYLLEMRKHTMSMHIFVLFLVERLGDLLMFATACEIVPPIGFTNPSVITILQNTSVLPNANTCPQELELPGLIEDYDVFRKRFNTVLDTQKHGFGVI